MLKGGLWFNATECEKHNTPTIVHDDDAAKGS